MFFMWPQIELLYKCSEFGEEISFRSKVRAILVKAALPILERFGIPLQWRVESTDFFY